MKLTTETQRKIFEHLWAEPATSGSKKGRVVAKAMDYLMKYVSEEVRNEPLNPEVFQRYEGDGWESYAKWGEDFVALLKEESKQGTKKQHNILKHAAQRAEHWLSKSEELVLQQ